MNTSRAGGAAPTAGSDDLSSVFASVCTGLWGAQSSPALECVFSGFFTVVVGSSASWCLLL